MAQRVISKAQEQSAKKKGKAMSYFTDTANMNIEMKSKRFEPGHYLVDIKEVKDHKGRKHCIIIEGTVLGSHPAATAEGAPEVGDTAAHVIRMDGSRDQADMGQKNFLGFLCAAYGKKPKELDDATWNAVAEAATQQNALKGLVMTLECYEITTKAGKPFTVYKWGRQATADDFARFELV